MSKKDLSTIASDINPAASPGVMLQTPPHTKRLFLALELSEDFKAALLASPVPISNSRMTAPDKLHLTLRFLGNIPPMEEEKLIAVCQEIPLKSPIPLHPEGFGAFPSLKKASSFHLKLKPLPVLTELKKLLDEKLELALGLPRENDYQPHITLCRMKSSPRELDLKALEAWTHSQHPPQTLARSLTLFHSQQLPEEPLHHIPLFQAPLP